MNSRDIVAILTALGLIVDNVMQRMEKIEVAKTIATACEASLRGLVP